MTGGRCLCGAVRYAVDAPPLWRAHCHCESCRRATASAFTTFFGMADGSWHLTGETPVTYASSPGARRMFCGRCGTQIAYAHDRFPGETHFYAATLDDQTGFAADSHVHWAERVDWVQVRDDLPKFPGSDTPDER